MSDLFLVYDTEELASTDHETVCQLEGIPRPETQTYKAYDWLPAKTGPRVYIPDNYFLQTYFPNRTRYTWQDISTMGLV
jgi:hypothetical protein